MKRIIAVLFVGVFLCSGVAFADLIFHDDFNDNDISDWAGGSFRHLNYQWFTPYVSNGEYVADNVGGERGGHHKGFDVPIWGSGFTLDYDVRSRRAYGQGVNHLLLIVDDEPLYYDTGGNQNANGYSVWVSSRNGNVGIQKLNNGVHTNLAESIFPNDELFHNVKIAHEVDGSWSIFVDSIEQSLSMNIIDNSFSSYSFVSTSLDINDSNPTNAFDNIYIYGDVAPVPEPTTMLLLGTGLIGLAGLRRKQKRS